MFQQVIVIGFVGQDPEVKTLGSGTAVANFSVATTEKWKDKNSGEQKERTEWFRCSAFGRLAEVIGEYVKKGSPITVIGRMQTRSYEKDGQTHYATDLIVGEMKLLPSGNRDGAQRQQGGGNSSNQSRGSSSNQSGSSQRPAQSDDFDDDIPF